MQAVVTNHLVVRGSYRSLSLVVYGNTAEDLGQFNIEFDDSSLTDIASSVEGNLEDLPLPIHCAKSTNEEVVCSLQALLQPDSVLDLSIEVKQLLQLVLKILEVQEPGNAVHKVVGAVVSAASAYITQDLPSGAINRKPLSWGRSKDSKELQTVISECKLELYKVLQLESGDMLVESSAECSLLEHDNNPVTSKFLVDMFHQYFHIESNSSSVRHPLLSKVSDCGQFCNSNIQLSSFLCTCCKSNCPNGI